MPQPKVPLLEMRDVVSAMLRREQQSMEVRSQSEKRLPSEADERRVVVLRTLLDVLSTLATYEDRARIFVRWLMAEHKGRDELLNLTADPFLRFGDLHEKSPEAFARIVAAADAEIAALEKAA